MIKEEKRIYVVIAATVQPEKGKNVTQPAGRQIAQACHVVSKLRFEMDKVFFGAVDSPVPGAFIPITTIILQARDSAELVHVYSLLMNRKFPVVSFQDENQAAYGVKEPTTGIAVLAAPSKMIGILDYLPLWGSQ